MKLEDSDKIILAGQVPFSDIPKYLCSADYCLLLVNNNQIMENIVPIKLYEYLSAGKPIISTRLKGVPKDFEEKNGVLYVDEPTEVFKVVKAKINNKSKIIQEGLNFVSKYDWNQIIPEFKSHLEYK